MKIVAYFVRHADTDWNDQDKFRGDIDIGINKEGQKQAEELVPYFEGKKFGIAFNSSRKRTKQTLAPLLSSRGMESKTTTKLDSLDTGELAGKPKTDENLKILKWYRKHPEEKIPGGDRVQDWRNRVDSELFMIMRRGEEASMPAIAGVHGSVIKELSRLLTGDMNKIGVEPGGVLGVFKTPKGYALRVLLKPKEGKGNYDDDRQGS